MANVAHSTLTGSNLHEPKGIGTATTGQVYVANGAGTGLWTDISATSFTGTVADFATPVAPTGWLECDGTDVSKITFPALFAALTIQNTATRGSGSPIVTLTTGNTTNMRPGYFVYGLVAGQFVSGTTIVSVDSGIQFTMSAGASSGGTATVVVSPWLLNTNTIRLPNLSAASRYRRARSPTIHMGVNQVDFIKNHTHTTTTGTESVDHTHSGTTGVSNQSLDHTHAYTGPGNLNQTGSVVSAQVYPNTPAQTGFASSSGYDLTSHNHGFTTGTVSAFHTHTGTSGNPDGGLGSTETRPVTLVLMTCIKT